MSLCKNTEYTAPFLCRENNDRSKIIARQQNPPQVNKTAQLPYEKLGNSDAFKLDFISSF